MNDTITRHLQNVSDPQTERVLQTVLSALADRVSSQSMSSAGLVIKAGASAIVKTGASAYYAVASGTIVTKAGSTDMPALAGTVTNAKFNTFSFFVDAGGNLTSVMGAEGASLATMKLAPIPVGKAQLGFVIINPTGTGNFVGGTTALDDATVVPNAVYINTGSVFDTTILP